ncbi:MAG TPA: hypothetical protein VJ986_14665 [Gaiellaceae bacterium]|nr:hypothetical protein [Gaiellaceae bacterium]
MRSALEKWAPWAAALVLVAGVAAYTATRLTGGSTSAPAAATVPAAEATVPLDPGARAVAKEFVATAVARRRLDRAWQLAAPGLRSGLTLAEWRTGNIPVQPYPVAQATAMYTVKASHAGDAILGVTFLPRAGSSAQPGRFTIGLQRLGGRWLVASFTPASAIAPSPSG